MKRFYCTICKRPRRVRKFPSNISNPAHADVYSRQGTCVWHDSLYRSSRVPVVVEGTWKDANVTQADARMIGRTISKYGKTQQKKGGR